MGNTSKRDQRHKVTVLKHLGSDFSHKCKFLLTSRSVDKAVAVPVIKSLWATLDLGSPAQDVIETWIQFNVVFVNVVIQIFCSQHLGYPHQLGTNRNISHYCEGMIMPEPAWRYTAAHSLGSLNLVSVVWTSSHRVISWLWLPWPHTITGMVNRPLLTVRT